MTRKKSAKVEWTRPCEKRGCDCGGYVDTELAVHDTGCAWLRSLTCVSWLPTQTVTALRSRGVEVWRVWVRGTTVPAYYARPAVETLLRATGVWYLPGKVAPPEGWDDFVADLTADARADGLPEALDLLCYTAPKRGNKTKPDAALHWVAEVSKTLPAFDPAGEVRQRLAAQTTAAINTMRKMRLDRVLVGD